MKVDIERLDSIFYYSYYYIMAKKKKPKSVERVKIRKPKTADIAQHASNADNANQQVVQDPID